MLVAKNLVNSIVVKKIIMKHDEFRETCFKIGLDGSEVKFFFNIFKKLGLARSTFEGPL